MALSEADTRAKLIDPAKPRAEQLTTMGRGVPLMLAILSAWHARIQQIVPWAGAIHRSGTGPRRRAIYLPFAVTLLVEPGPQQERLSTTAPAIAAMSMRDGKPTAYVCRNFACQQPTTDPDELMGLLARS